MGLIKILAKTYGNYFLTMQCKVDENDKER